MIHDTKRQPDSTSDGGGNVAVVITPLLIQLLSQLHTNIQQQLDKPMLTLLASGMCRCHPYVLLLTHNIGLSRERSCSQVGYFIERNFLPMFTAARRVTMWCCELTRLVE